MPYLQNYMQLNTFSSTGAFHRHGALITTLSANMLIT